MPEGISAEAYANRILSEAIHIHNTYEGVRRVSRIAGGIGGAVLVAVGSFSEFTNTTDNITAGLVILGAASAISGVAMGVMNRIMYHHSMERIGDID